ncbi:hypothetical protein [Ralstonia solanacearum]|nr:hypothetical protein [Ralstonia solanacearum]MDC6178249.1 hypothetical protein [Ralstonia solanacearum]MDC6210156.1 hypothetical protein [Ralstonia solanacearum]MDC6240443.1 hypothetical protein [Ralstonia solanacearum]MDD7801428.1 hypothetical protein [Ralstonia solanacearum]
MSGEHVKQDPPQGRRLDEDCRGQRERKRKVAYTATRF